MKCSAPSCKKMVIKGLNCHRCCHMTSLQHHGVIVTDWYLVIRNPGVIMMSQARGGWAWIPELNIKEKIRNFPVCSLEWGVIRKFQKQHGWKTQTKTKTYGKPHAFFLYLKIFCIAWLCLMSPQIEALLYILIFRVVFTLYWCLCRDQYWVLPYFGQADCDFISAILPSSTNALVYRLKQT